jgi:fermentation-respiration switch protein FrsA (DUF1100 family)
VRLTLIAAAIGALVYALLVVAAWEWQERLVWQPPTVMGAAESGAQRLTYTAADRRPLAAFLVGDPLRARGLLIAFHGNAEVARSNIPWATEVERRTGWAVLLPEYRGYDGLAGTPTYAGSRQDMLATYALARTQLGVDSTRIALYGHSLGTAVAAELADAHAPGALLMLAPLTSAREMARTILFPADLLWPLIGRIHFDTRAIVSRLDAPVFVAQGDHDGVIPVAMGRRVYAAAHRKGELLIVPGAGHNNVMDVAGERYWTWLVHGLRAADAGQAGGRVR